MIFGSMVVSKRFEDQKEKNSESINTKKGNSLFNIDFRLVIGIIIGNIFGFVVLILLFRISFITAYLLFSISALTSAIVTSTIADGKKKTGILPGLLSTITLILSILEFNAITKNFPAYVIIILVVIISSLGGVIGNYLGRKTKSPLIVFFIIILLILIILLGLSFVIYT